MINILQKVNDDMYLINKSHVSNINANYLHYEEDEIQEK